MATEIPKSAAKTLRVARSAYNGHDPVAVRVFTGQPGDPDARPTQKGLTLRPATWQEVLPALGRLRKEGEASGDTDEDNN